jgi:D-aspartate ligase
MASEQATFFPVIIGSEFIAYYMARCFNDAYGIVPLVIGRQAAPSTSHSSIVEVSIVEDLWDEDIFITTLLSTAERLKKQYEQLILIPTSDMYVRMVSKHAKLLQNHYLFNCVSADVLDEVQLKSNFYRLCHDNSIDIPETISITVTSALSCPDILPTFPIIVKPADVDMYYRHPFAGQKKIYKLHSRQELIETIDLVRQSGYHGELVCQEFIPGDDTSLYDMVIYVDSKGSTRSVSFSRVLLQEHTPQAIGNLTALITRSNPEFMREMSHFAEVIHFRGFGNFDIKFDERDGKFKILELNVRQGRSSYYMSAQGSNMASLLVEDLISHQEQAVVYHDEQLLFSVVPIALVCFYARRKGLVVEILRNRLNGHFANPLSNPKDRSFKRLLWKVLRHCKYYYLYSRNKW